MMSDPISDFLSRIRNALMIRREKVELKSSKMLERIADILEKQGYVEGYTVEKVGPSSMMQMRLKYDEKGLPVIEGLRRISKPGLRVYTDAKSHTQIRGGMGISIVSTSRGMMTGTEAKQERIGGEVICHVW